MNHITFFKIPLSEILMTAEQPRNYFLRFQDAFRHVHVKIKNHNFAALLLSFSKCGFDTIFALDTFPVSKLSVDSVFRILMPYG